MNLQLVTYPTTHQLCDSTTTDETQRQQLFCLAVVRAARLCKLSQKRHPSASVTLLLPHTIDIHLTSRVLILTRLHLSDPVSPATSPPNRLWSSVNCAKPNSSVFKRKSSRRLSPLYSLSDFPSVQLTYRRFSPVNGSDNTKEREEGDEGTAKRRSNGDVEMTRK